MSSDYKILEKILQKFSTRFSNSKKNNLMRTRFRAHA